MDSDTHPVQSGISAPSSTSMQDTASSLRAAALLSRKRRKVAPETPVLSLRITPEPSLQLDYGQANQDESPSTQKTESNTTPVSQHTVTPRLMNQKEDIEDGQIREEGEISDSETSTLLRLPSPPSRARRRLSVLQPPQTQETSKTEIPLPLRPPSPARTETALPSESVEHSWQPISSTSVEPFVFETCTYRLDANHVRPGLAMTQEQYNTAKDIVLDLLGWGVPPEYLLECGLSRHVIYYVFAELNLRLPNNLDISGLIPYPTPEMLALIPVSPSLSARSPHSSPSAMPPPSVIPARVSLTERMSMERIDTEMLSPDRSPYVKPEPSSPSSADLSNSHSLLMIEQQRRQELLARKAVIASRKARHSEPPSSTQSKDQDADMVTAPQSVDDFLKTIEPPARLDIGDLEDHNGVPSVGTTPFSEGMNVDAHLPSLIGMQRGTSTLSAGPSSTQSLFSASTTTYNETDSPATFQMSSTGDVEASSGLHRRATIPMDDTPSSHPPTLQLNPSYASMDDSNYPQRRGTKRPVAADFVDFDGPGPSRGIGNSYTNGYSNGGSLSRRKTGSFAGITGSRRCVIELSDSEDDGDVQVRGDYAGNGDTREYSPVVTPGFSARNPQRLTATPTMSAVSVSNGNSGQSPQTLPTNALAEKEEEIKRMRLLIAQREELRLKRLAAMSGKSTPVVPLITDAQGQEAMLTVKEEDSGSSYGHHASRDRQIDYRSIADSISNHGTSAAVSDGNTALLLTDNCATQDAPGSFDDLDDGLSVQETSTTGRELCVEDDDLEDEQDLMITGEVQTTAVARIRSFLNFDLLPTS